MSLTMFRAAKEKRETTHLKYSELEKLDSINLINHARKSYALARQIVTSSISRDKLSDSQLCSIGAQYTEIAFDLIKDREFVSRIQMKPLGIRQLERMASMQPYAAVYILVTHELFPKCNIELIQENLELERQSNLTSGQFEKYSKLTKDELCNLMYYNFRLAMLILKTPDLANKLNAQDLYNLIIHTEEKPVLALTILNTPALANKLCSHDLYRLFICNQGKSELALTILKISELTEKLMHFWSNSPDLGLASNKYNDSVHAMLIYNSMKSSEQSEEKENRTCFSP